MHGKSLGCNTGICWARVLVRSHFKLADAAEVSPSEGMLFFLSLTACHGSFTSSWSKISLYSKICLENSCTAAPASLNPVSVAKALHSPLRTWFQFLSLISRNLKFPGEHFCYEVAYCGDI